MNKSLHLEETGRIRRAKTIVIPLAERFDVAVRRRYTDEGSAFTGLVPEVLRFNALLTSAQNRLTRDVGLNCARWRVLEVVALTGKPQSVARLARVVRLTRQAVQALVNDLEKDGYLSFTGRDADRQSKRVVLTAKGLAGHRTATRRQVPWANRIADGLGPGELVEATRVVRLLVERLALAEAETARSPSERCGFSAKLRVARAKRREETKRNERRAR